MQHRVIRQLTLSPEPALFVGRTLVRAQRIDRVHRADLNRTITGQLAMEFLRDPIEQFAIELLFSFQSQGVRSIGHGDLVVEPVLIDLERHRAGEDFLAILPGDDPAYRETAAVADPLNIIVNGRPGVARPQEIRVHGVRPAAFDGAGGCHQRLPQHVAAKQIGEAQIFTLTLKMIVADGRKVH